jgi:hypothetical protein
LLILVVEWVVKKKKGDKWEYEGKKGSSGLAAMAARMRGAWREDMAMVPTVILMMMMRITAKRSGAIVRHVAEPTGSVWHGMRQIATHCYTL